MLPHSDPDIQAAPRQAVHGARSFDPEVPGSSSSTNTQDHWQRPESQQPAPQGAAAAFAARLSPDQRGDISVGDIIVRDRGSFVRGNTLNAPYEMMRDRKWVGDVKVGMDANVVDQNQFWSSPDSAFRQNRSQTSEASQSPPEQESVKPDGQESNGPGGRCCRLL